MNDLANEERFFLGDIELPSDMLWDVDLPKVLTEEEFEDICDIDLDELEEARPELTVGTIGTSRISARLTRAQK